MNKENYTFYGIIDDNGVVTRLAKTREEARKIGAKRNNTVKVNLTIEDIQSYKN